MPDYHKCEASWHLSMACIYPGGASVRSVRWTTRSQSRGQRMTTQLAVRTTMTKTGPMKTASTTTRTVSTRRSKKNRHLRHSLISRRCCRLLRQERPAASAETGQCQWQEAWMTAEKIKIPYIWSTHDRCYVPLTQGKQTAQKGLEKEKAHIRTCSFCQVGVPEHI